MRSVIKLAKIVLSNTFFKNHLMLCGDKRLKKVFLTFDDGPNYDFTLKILEVLKKYKIKATFFVVGEEVAKYPEIIQAILKNEHELGNHSYTHREFTTLGRLEIEDEIRETFLLLRKINKKRCYLFRAPRGRFRLGLLLLAIKLNFKIVLWSKVFPPENKKINVFVENVKEGDIILLHDDEPGLIEMLPTLIKGLLERGFNCSTL